VSTKEKRETKVPQSYDELFPGRFLKSGLFKGKAVTLTISAVEMEKMPDPDVPGAMKWKVVMAFREREMQLILNKTNGECLKGMWGKRVADWIGKRVTMHVRKVRGIGGQMVDGIRILGSPDIERDIDVECQIGVVLATIRLKKTAGKIAETAPPPESEPEADEFDPDTGELQPDSEVAQGGA
jgi:hypothetical protein